MYVCKYIQVSMPVCMGPMLLRMHACKYVLCMHYVRMYVYMYVCIYRGGFFLQLGEFCPGGFCLGTYVRGVAGRACPFLRPVPPSSLCSLQQVSFVFIINFYFATAYSVYAWIYGSGVFNNRCGASHIHVFYVFDSWGQRFFYIFVLNGIQLNLQAFWLQGVKLAPICHRRRVVS